MAIYTYCRAPMGLRVEEDGSLETQQRQVRGYAQMHGFVIAAHFVESGVSGLVHLGERTQGQHLLAVLKSGDIVITPKLDRMFRLARDALDTMTELQERGVALHVIDLGGDFTANGIAKPVFTTLAAVAGPKRRRAQKRIVKPERDQRSRTRLRRGNAPFGFALLEDGTLTEVPDEQRAIRELLQKRAEGLSFHALAGFMAGLGFSMGVSRLKDILARYPSEEGIPEQIASPNRKHRPYGPTFHTPYGSGVAKRYR